MSDVFEVFISYADEDRDFAKRLVDDLRQRGHHCFLARDSLVPGRSWPAEIRKAIQEVRAGIVVWSEHAAGSQRVEEEITALLDRGPEFPLTPILVGSFPEQLEYRLRNRQHVDFRAGYEGALEQLASALPPPGLAPPPSPPPPPGFSLYQVLAALLFMLLGMVILLAVQTWLERQRSQKAVRRQQGEVERIAERSDRLAQSGAGVDGTVTHRDPQTREIVALDTWKDGRQIERALFDDDRPVAKDRFVYDEAGRVVKKVRSYLDPERGVFLVDTFAPDGSLLERHCPGGQSADCGPRLDVLRSPLPAQVFLSYR